MSKCDCKGDIIKVIIPPNTVNPERTTLIEIPRDLVDEDTLIATPEEEEPEFDDTQPEFEGCGWEEDTTTFGPYGNSQQSTPTPYFGTPNISFPSSGMTPMSAGYTRSGPPTLYQPTLNSSVGMPNLGQSSGGACPGTPMGPMRGMPSKAGPAFNIFSDSDRKGGKKCKPKKSKPQGPQQPSFPIYEDSQRSGGTSYGPASSSRRPFTSAGGNVNNPFGGGACRQPLRQMATGQENTGYSRSTSRRPVSSGYNNFTTS